MKKYKTKLSAQNAKEIILFIEHILTMQPQISIIQCIGFAALLEVRTVIAKKTIEYKREYSISLTAVQAMGLSYMYMTWLGDDKRVSQFNNRMMQINNEILQHYSL